MNLYLIRHGQTEWNARRRAQGQTDVSLDATGRAQAEALGKAFAGIRVNRVLSSDLKRCVETSEPIVEACGCRLETDRTLRERTFGAWEGMDYTRLHQSFAELGRQRKKDSWEVRPPNGESLADVWKRITPTAGRIERFGGDQVVVTHGGVGGLLVAKFIRGCVATSRSFRFGNASITHLRRYDDGCWRVMSLAETDHLQDVDEPAGVLG